MPSYSLLLGVGTILSSLSGQAVAAVYEQQEKFSASNWLDAFHFETYELTNGYVDYVDQDVAENLGLYKADGEDIIFGADSHEKLDPSDDNIFGRKSVRLEGNTDYNHGLFVIDIQHMPTACGMWPAFWSLGREPWPVKGEIDIVEGVNANTRNKYVLHTDTECKVDGQGQSYPQLNNDCALDGANGAAGCDVDDGRTNSFGKGFNDNHGGYYVMEWASDAIKTWFFPRGSQLPASLTGTAPDTSEFGQPAANFKGDCNIEERFKDQRFIFTNTFCGDWAGNAYASSSCPKYKGPNGETLDSVSMCKKHVAEHPEDFMEAYWKVSSFRTFTKRTIVSSSSVAPSSTPISSSVHVSSTEVHVDSASSSAPHVDATSSSVHYSATASSAPHVDATSSSVHHDASASPSVHYDASSSSVYHDASASPSVHYDASASSSVYYATNTPAVSSAYDSHHDYPAESSYPAHPSSSGKPYGVYPAGNSSAPYHHGTAYGTGYAASSAKPDYHTYNEPYGNAAKSTPCSTSSAKKAYQTDVYAVYPDSKSSAVVYGEYNAKPSKPVKNDYPYLPDFTPVSPIYPDVTSKPSYGNDYGYDSYPEGSKTVYTTTYTTSYVDVCETGYTTIKTTHVVTYTATATPAAHPTPGNDYPVYPPPGFEITTKVCNKGCGEGPKTVTVTLPCDKCGYYPSEETGKIVTPIPAMPTQPAEEYNTIYSKVYSTKVITLSKIVVHQSEYPAQHQSAPVYGEDKPTKPTHAEEVPSHPVYTPIHGQPGKPVMPSSGYGYPAKNGTTTYATGAVKPSASMTGYNTPEFTGAASSFKAGGMVAAAAFAALLL